MGEEAGPLLRALRKKSLWRVESCRDHLLGGKEQRESLHTYKGSVYFGDHQLTQAWGMGLLENLLSSKE